MSPVNRTQEVRQRLLDEGLALILQQGYGNTGIKEIVDRALIPKGSFYNYFGSKEAFVMDIIRQYSDWFIGHLDDALVHSDADAKGAIQTLFQGMIDYFAERQFQDGCLVGNLSGEMADTHDPIREALATALAEWQERLARLVTNAQLQGGLRTDIPAETIAEILLNSFEGAVLKMKVEQSSRPLDQWLHQMLDNLLAA